MPAGKGARHDEVGQGDPLTWNRSARLRFLLLAVVTPPGGALTCRIAVVANSYTYALVWMSPRGSDDRRLGDFLDIEGVPTLNC